MFPNLKSEMTRYNVTVDALSGVIGKASVNVRLRLNGGKPILFGEAVKIRDYFNSKFGTNFTLEYLFSYEPTQI